ncbi:hypothetical protein ACFE04_023792 [Oxalis oulophora]
MKIRPWLHTTCSSTSCTTTDDSITPAPKKHYLFTKSYISDTSSSSFSSSLTSYSSLQTLPSVPSLQKLSPPADSLNLSISHRDVISIKPNPFPITCLAIYNNHLLYAACGHEIFVYDRATCTHLDTFNGHDSSSGSIKSISFSNNNNNNNKVFTAHQDCKIRVWQLTDQNKRHKLLTVLPTVNDRLRRFILPSSYITVRRHKKKLWIEHDDAVTAIAVNNGFMYSVSWDRSFKIWRDSDLRCLESVRAHGDAVNAVVVSQEGTIYTGSADGSIRVWGQGQRVGEKRGQVVLLSTLEKHKSAVNALALTEEASMLFSGACDRSILVWEKEDSANQMVLIGALRGHKNAILCLVYVNGLLLSGSSDRTVRIWQRIRMDHGIGRFSCLGVLEGHAKPVKSLVAVGEEDGVVSVYSGSFDGEIKLWQLSLSVPALITPPSC